MYSMPLVFKQSQSFPSFLQPLLALNKPEEDAVAPVRLLESMCDGVDTEVRGGAGEGRGGGREAGAGTRRLLRRLQRGQSNCILSVSSIMSI